MTRSDLAAAIAEKTGSSKSDSEEWLRAFEDVVTDNVRRGEKIQLTGFMSFERQHKPAGTARNPQTGETIQVAAKMVPKVKVGAAFKKAVNV